MKQLLKTEWLKLKDYSAFKILSIFFVVGVVLSNYIFYRSVAVVTEQKTASMLMGKYNPYSFENTWQTTSFVTGCLLILPAMLLVILVTNEFTYRTNRQNIIDGWSRRQFIDVKLVLAFWFALATTVIALLTAFVFGLATSEDGFSFYKIVHLLYLFLKALSYNVIAVFIAVLVRRTGFAIGVFFIYLWIENIIANLLDFWSRKIKMDTGYDLGSMGDYLPMNASDGLLPFPDNPLKSMAKSVMPTDYTWLVFGFALAYLVLFIWLSRRRIIESDL
ncbi:MAG: ABC transporter permease [Ferruginibacter sp.]